MFQLVAPIVLLAHRPTPLSSHVQMPQHPQAVMMDTTLREELAIPAAIYLDKQFLHVPMYMLLHANRDSL